MGTGGAAGGAAPFQLIDDDLITISCLYFPGKLANANLNLNREIGEHSVLPTGKLELEDDLTRCFIQVSTATFGSS